MFIQLTISYSNPKGDKFLFKLQRVSNSRDSNYYPIPSEPGRSVKCANNFFSDRNIEFLEGNNKNVRLLSTF